jgi:hypothetical protein
VWLRASVACRDACGRYRESKKGEIMRPITDLTDRGAMQKAIREALEAHKNGRDFVDLYPHGYERSGRWVVRVDSVEIDSKPLAATAFYHQHNEFPVYIRGGTRALRTALRQVGYELEERKGPVWTTPTGTRGTKSDFAALYGGGTLGGIQPSSTSKNVLLYSDPAVGTAFGYNFDGWTADGETYSYTGEGQRGPQNLRSGNGAILNHKAHGRSLRLLVADGYADGKTRAKDRIYVGEFTLDESHPYSIEDALDMDGQMRTVYVFHLKPVGEVLHRGADYSAAPMTPKSEAVAEKVALETHLASEFESSGSGPVTAEKREQALVEKFSEVLAERGHQLSRWKITPPESTRPLYSDIFDETAGILYEAKAKSTRNHVRMGLGQILDYKRYTPAEVTAFALLLPAEPHSDLLNLLRGQGLGAVWPDAQTGLFVQLTVDDSKPF